MENYENIWMDVYILNNYDEDPHGEFSRRTGLDRQSAKVVCYTLMNDSKFLQKHIEMILEDQQ